MNELDVLLSAWADEVQPNQTRLNEIRLAARLDDSDLDAEWWQMVLSIPKTAFLTWAA
ncbi:MAG: hypothetical protein JST12_10260 [Armatimonadetes bacterium]|nr:hypothetical protein [Armatimonadota bacterium]